MVVSRFVPGLLGVLLASSVAAETRPPIVVTDPSARTYRVAVQKFAAPRSSARGGETTKLREEIVESLEFSGLFTSLSPSAFLGPETTVSLGREGEPICPNWRQIGTDALLEGELHEESGQLRIESRVRDVARGCKSLLRKRYRGTSSELDRIARVIADDLVEAFTGRAGVADTEIAFVSTRSGTKEIYVMGADGSSVRRATHNRSINAFPSWSPDGNAIAYTSYRERQRPGLFLLTRNGHSPGRILRRLAGGAPQYRGVFDPKGQRLAVVLSADGAAEIFAVGRSGRNPRRLTRNRAIDIAPTWSPDGRRIAFVSDRAGSPQVYVMNADGSGVRRLTYDGSYNTAPAWSPDGRWIAYESRVGGQFDIWLIDPEGTVNVPFVAHPRSDESPTWSPDGRKLAFSSTRRGRADIYVVDVTGENLRRITEGTGDNTSPAWGPYRR